MSCSSCLAASILQLISCEAGTSVMKHQGSRCGGKAGHNGSPRCFVFPLLLDWVVR
jgi:hypothetical protein